MNFLKLQMILFLSCAALSGCKTTNWDNAPERYTCTDEQMEKAIKEAEQAIRIDSNKYPKYHYGAAIMRNCELMSEY